MIVIIMNGVIYTIENRGVRQTIKFANFVPARQLKQGNDCIKKKPR